MRISDWSSDVCSSDLPGNHDAYVAVPWEASLAKWAAFMQCEETAEVASGPESFPFVRYRGPAAIIGLSSAQPTPLFCAHGTLGVGQLVRLARSEEHTSELQSLMRISYAVFCWKK